MNKYQQDRPIELHFGSNEVFLISLDSLETTTNNETLEKWISTNMTMLGDTLDGGDDGHSDVIYKIVEKRFQRGQKLARLLIAEVERRKDRITTLTVRVLCPKDPLPVIESRGGYSTEITYEEIVNVIFRPYTRADVNNIVQITHDATVRDASATLVGSNAQNIIIDVEKVFEQVFDRPKSPSMTAPSEPWAPAVEPWAPAASTAQTGDVWFGSHRDSWTTFTQRSRTEHDQRKSERKVQTLQTLRSSKRNPCNCTL